MTNVVPWLIDLWFDSSLAAGIIALPVLLYDWLYRLIWRRRR
jgi:hypothetical protein